jgi:hypothetical protein
MLKNAFLTAVAIFVTLPVILYAAMSSMMDSLSESTVREKVMALLNEGTHLPWVEKGHETAIPDFRNWKETGDIPDAFYRPLPGRMVKWLKYQSTETVEKVFRDAFAALKPSEIQEQSPETALKRWRLIAHAACGGLLSEGVELTLNKGCMDGVEVCLELPCLEYFIDHAEKGWKRKAHEPELEYLLAYQSTYEPRAYPDQPWFMKWSGDRILESLCKKKRPALEASIAKAMHAALARWKPPYIRPWLPLAYFAANPGRASPEVLDTYLRRTLENEECPYMLNAAALFLHIAGEDRIASLLRDLKSRSGTGEVLDLEQDTMTDPEFLYWFLVASAPELCRHIPLVASRALEGKEGPRPKSLGLIVSMWNAARDYAEGNARTELNLEGAFLLLMKGLYPENSPQAWLELGVIPHIHGHCFMAFH